MPFTVQQLINDRQRPHTVVPTDPLQTALAVMTEHDFSQLPVVDAYDKPLGLVTSDSILRALNHFMVTPNDLRVTDAMIRPVTKRNDEDLFDLLDDLRDTYAILIVDGENTLVGIVTSYDTTDYFRRRTEDILFVQDVEMMIKEFALAAFKTTKGEIHADALATAITDIMPSDRELRSRFRKALTRYLELKGEPSTQPMQNWLEEAFTEHLALKPTPKPVDTLTLYEFTELFLYNQRWPFYSETFSLKPDAIRRLLDPVRETRNALAHLREITQKQREQLHFCKEWLSGYQPPIPTLPPVNPMVEPPVLPPTDHSTETGTTDVSEPEGIEPVDEVPLPGENRYEQIARWLKRQSRRDERIQLSFRQVEEIIGTDLPPSARRHRAWWANDSVSHVQSQSWLSADWRVTEIDMREERVVFARMRERETAYIDFFSALNRDLKHASPVFKPNSPNGQSWITVRKISLDNRPVASCVFSFTRDARFRVELYLDTGHGESNRTLLHALRHSFDDHAEVWGDLLDEKIHWEELPDKRGSRVAVYHQGSVTGSKDDLAQLRQWAVPMMINLSTTFERLGPTLRTLLPD